MEKFEDIILQRIKISFTQTAWKIDLAQDPVLWLICGTTPGKWLHFVKTPAKLIEHCSSYSGPQYSHLQKEPFQLVSEVLKFLLPGTVHY